VGSWRNPVTSGISGFFILSEKQDDLRQEHSLDLENHVLRGRGDM